MKKFLLLLLPVLMFSYEINFNKTFSKDVMPDILSANISVSIEDDEERVVIKRLKVFNKEIKAYKKVEKELGRFNVRPIYQHSSNSPLIKGYKGTLSYKISSKDALFIGEFVEKITSLKTNRDTTVSLNNLSWRVKKETLSVINDLLRLEAITWAENYVKTLSSDLNRECVVKSIDFNNSFRPSYTKAVRLSNMSKSNEGVVVPEMAQENKKLNTNFKVECK